MQEVSQDQPNCWVFLNTFHRAFLSVWNSFAYLALTVLQYIVTVYSTHCNNNKLYLPSRAQLITSSVQVLFINAGNTMGLQRQTARNNQIQFTVINALVQQPDG